MDNYTYSGKFLIDIENDFNLMLRGSESCIYLKIRANYRDCIE
jgi:hypothetical protein